MDDVDKKHELADPLDQGPVQKCGHIKINNFKSENILFRKASRLNITRRA